MSIPKVDDIVLSFGGYLVGKVIRMWEDGCIVDFQYEDNDDESPCFGENKTEFDEIEVISDPALATYLNAVRDKEITIQRLWPMYNDEIKEIIEIRNRALREKSQADILAGLDKAIELLSAMYEKSIR